MSSLPIYWGESKTIEGLLEPERDAGWVRSALETRYDLEPLDTLDADALASFEHLMLAQPRALSPQENVALDNWVRAGGKVLIFADPLLTAHSDLPIGDKRRPQDVALLSPILDHWGLELLLDDRVTDERRIVAVFGQEFPVAVPGRLRSTNSSCSITSEGLLAECPIGKGKATVFADAAVLEDSEGTGGDTPDEALAALLDRAFR